MPDFITTFQTLQNTPLPNVLVVAGIIFIFLAIAGQFAWEIKIGSKQQIFAGVIGMIFLIFGVSLYVIPTVQPNPNEEKPTVPLTVAHATSDLVVVDTPLFADTSTPNPTVSPTLTKKTEGSWEGVVSKDNAFVMRESHTLSQLVVVLKTGDIVEINATNQEKTWVKILAKNSSIRGWLPISDLKIDFDLEVLPIAE